MRLDSGNVLAAKMNSHRHQWNGTICSQPQAWNCGADTAFRANYCDAGVPRCFHLNVFRPSNPKFQTPDSSVVLAIQQQPKLLDDQLMVFYGVRFGAQQGIVPGDYEQTLFGFYRIKHASLDRLHPPYRLVIEPHADSWVMFPRILLRPSALHAVPGVAYLKQLRAKALKVAIEEALEAAASHSKADGWNSDLQRRLQRAADQLPTWLHHAEQAQAKLPAPSEITTLSASFGGRLEGPMAAKLRGIRINTVPSMPTPDPGYVGGATPIDKATAQPPRPLDAVAPNVEVAEPELGTKASDNGEAAPKPDPLTTNGNADAVPVETELQPAAPDRAAKEPLSQMRVAAVSAEQPSAELTGSQDNFPIPAQTPFVAEGDEQLPSQAVPEPRARQMLLEQFGLPLTDALSVAFITKALVILTGAPGAGKSWIASRLLDDSERRRTVIVPVASTWRGREDLLGYVNPINGNFEATEFTQFLCDAQQAWEKGDQRVRLIVFEEFNLSQPEHWLSDLLVRLEYDPDQLADRTIRLGGVEIAGRPGRSCSVTLVPNIRFVATLNNDHTVKPLSPRVLDRAALIEVTSSGRAALSRAGVELGDDVEDLIDELNDLLEPRGAAFSVRSARSLQRAIEAGSSTGMSLAKALDLVLAQEVLSRVRLLAGDPRDEQLLARLQLWTQKSGSAELTGCAARIGDWADLLSTGRDVFQA